MSLETMIPNPDRDTDEEALETFAAQADELTIRVWGADWCGDCQELLPDFAAVLDAAGISDERIETYAVNREKEGKLVEEYGIEYIPTIIIEREGQEVARFVESEPEPPSVFLAEQLTAAEPTQ
ncbi:MAG TPA: thioredoxin family protein [Halococcus sp.]|nr:thioredoxin family protein [Halococcus sp.]